MIEDRTAVKPGVHLTATHKKVQHFALVLEDGKILLQRPIEDTTPLEARTFPSLSAAGIAVTGTSTNGWRFWSIDKRAPEERTGPIDLTAETTCVGSVGPQRGSRNFRVAPNQKGLEPDERRWWCMCCQKSFKAPKERDPETCPEGHPFYAVATAEAN